MWNRLKRVALWVSTYTHPFMEEAMRSEQDWG